MTTPEADVPQTTIVIDGLTYRVPAGQVAGADVRRIPHPPISPDRDVWLVDADGADRYLYDEDEVLLVDGMRFITAPRSILAG